MLEIILLAVSVVSFTIMLVGMVLTNEGVI
jgi:hypothetical protein